MKRLLLSGLLAIITTISYSQIVARLYYNKRWQLTKKDSAVYFRVSIFDTTNRVFAGEVKDFTKDGKLVMKGSYKRGKKNGEFIFYFENGKTKSNGLYDQDLRSGRFKYYYPNGKL